MAKKTAAKKKVATTKPKATPNKKNTVKPAKVVAVKPASVKSVKTSPAKVAKSAIKTVAPKPELKSSPKSKTAKVVKEAPKKAITSPSKETHVLEGTDSFVASQLAKFDRSQMNEEQSRWYDYARKFGKVPPREYKMTEQFEAQTPIFHKVLGWGYIVSNEFDRLEVVFESGKKMLISNYKSN